MLKTSWQTIYCACKKINRPLDGCFDLHTEMGVMAMVGIFIFNGLPKTPLSKLLHFFLPHEMTCYSSFLRHTFASHSSDEFCVLFGCHYRDLLMEL